MITCQGISRAALDHPTFIENLENLSTKVLFRLIFLSNCYRMLIFLIKKLSIENFHLAALGTIQLLYYHLRNDLDPLNIF